MLLDRWLTVGGWLTGNGSRHDLVRLPSRENPPSHHTMAKQKAMKTMHGMSEARQIKRLYTENKTLEEIRVIQRSWIKILRKRLAAKDGPPKKKRGGRGTEL